MSNRRFVVAALAAVVLGVLAASAQAFVGMHTNQLTFSGAVALPGVVLPSGSYSFEAMQESSNLVRVWNRNHTRVFYTGFTRQVDRPRNLDPKRTVILGEATRGEAPPITVWYPIGEARGHEFIYAR